MDQNEVDRRIAEAQARKTTVQVPGQYEQHPVIVEQGSTLLAPSSAAGLGQVDVTLRVNAEAENRNAGLDREARRKLAGQPGHTIGDNYTMPDNAGIEPVRLGTVTLQKSGLQGWEKQFTAHASDYQLLLEDGTVVHSVHEIVKLLHAEAYRIKLSKVAK